MTDITKERLKELSVGHSGLNLRIATHEESMELARIALASLEAPIIPVMYKGVELLTKEGLELIRDGLAEATSLESMAMAQALLSARNTLVIPPAIEPDYEAIQRILPTANPDEYACCIAADMWNACRAAVLQSKVYGQPELTVWYGSMPETNGKANWTAILHRKGHHPWEGITIARSEYPDRVRYEADCMRHLIGELADEPDILAYDADKHSGYVEPVTEAVQQPLSLKPHVYRELVNQLRDTATKYTGTQQLREQISRTLQRVLSSDVDDTTLKGWKLVPEIANEDMIDEGNIMAACMINSVEKIDVSLIYGAMIAAAPQPEEG